MSEDSVAEEITMNACGDGGRAETVEGGVKKKSRSRGAVRAKLSGLSTNSDVVRREWRGCLVLV